ncbi:MAG: hypothetical protein A2X23_11100 [Chloroflexi bacterium GWC2_73_18]|nr:MAG: hypothetical protein A2X23_11100 [Chloroflexi bacterium GWC2_73_18]
MRDTADDATGEVRDRAPDLLAPIDANAPVSGHHVPDAPGAPAVATGHDWESARGRIYPLLRPTGTVGIPLEEALTAPPTIVAAHGSARPIVRAGPCDLVVVYGMAAGGYDVLVNRDHLLSWGVLGADVEEAALANLAAWSREATWVEETSGSRRLVSSATGEGYDAARILLPEARAHLATSLAEGLSDPARARLLVGLPERHLLVAGALLPGDDEFATLFHEFLVEQSGAADEPVDRRVFELVGGELIEFAG